MSVRRQCELLGLNRSTLYYEPAPETPENLGLMRLIDERVHRPARSTAAGGSTGWLSRPGPRGEPQAGAAADAGDGAGGHLPQAEAVGGGPGHKVYPYLLRDVAIERADQVWSADITYVPLPSGFMYLAATIDWYSRYVVAWRLSNTLDGSFCLEMLEEALGRGTPEVFNTDQGVQFTAGAWTGRLESAGVAVSMDGRGRCLDNVFVERLWRSVKYEDVYLKGYERVPELEGGLRAYFGFYNAERLHQSLDYRTPAEVYGVGAKTA